jgi:NAD(P)-dependent dehydrogenase (short-subunit alcohol dehydrogenase family)
MSIDGIAYEIDLGSNCPQYLADHRIHGVVLFPASGYLEMMHAAVEASTRWRCWSLDGIEILEALSLPQGQVRRVRVTFVQSGDDEGSLEVLSCPRGDDGDQRTLHVRARTRVRDEGLDTQDKWRVPDSPATIQARLEKRVRGSDFYRVLEERGISYGSAFRGMTEVCSSTTEAVGRVVLSKALETEAGLYTIHPAQLDACLQVVGALASQGDDGQDAYIPVAAERVTLMRRAGSVLWSHVRVRENMVGQDRGIFDIEIVDDSGKEVAKVDGLQMRRLRRPESSESIWNEWLHEVVWRPAARSNRESSEPGRWIIVGDAGGVGQRLLDRMVRAGRACELLWRGKRGNEGRGETIGDTLAMAMRTGPIRGVVYLASLDIEEPVEGRCPGWEEILEAGASGAHWVARVLIAVPQQPAPRLCIVTKGARSVNGAVVSPFQATVWGLGATIRHEWPTLRCSNVDLGTGDEDELAELAAHLQREDADEQLAVRGTEAFVPLLAKFGGSGRPRVLSQLAGDRGCYVVSGGTGGLGLFAMEWLASRGAQAIALIARHQPGPKASALIELCRARGVAVRTFTADIANRSEVEKVLSTVRDGFKAIRGLVHAAGVLDDGLLSMLDRSRFASVFAAKVVGTWNLHNSTCSDPLDFFITFSSVAGVLGGPGQGNYAAANSFLDAMADYRRSHGLPATNINWGPWTATGMSLDARAETSWSHRQLRRMDRTVGLQALEQILACDGSNVAVFGLNGNALPNGTTGAWASPFVAELVASAKASRGETLASSSFHSTAGPSLAEPELEEFVQGKIASVLGTSTSSVALDVPLAGLGVDSLMALQLTNNLEGELGVFLSLNGGVMKATARDLARAVRNAAGSSHRDGTTAAASASAGVGTCHATTVATPGEHDEGYIPLLPAQEWFLAREPIDPHHANLTLLVRSESPVDPETLSGVIEDVFHQHEALRLRFQRDERGGWTQRFDPSVRCTFDHHDLCWVPEDGRIRALEERIAELQTTLCLELGLVARFASFNLGPALGSRLLIIVHWLCADAFSMRILLEHLYEQLSARLAGRPSELRPSPISYQNWGRSIHRRAIAGEFLASMAAFRRMSEIPIAPIPVDFSSRPSEGGPIACTTVTLDEMETRKVHQAITELGFDMRLLVTVAFGRALRRWSGQAGHLVTFSGHGRDVAGADLSRLVGRLAYHFPMPLAPDLDAPFSANLVAIEAQLRDASMHGFGYGLISRMPGYASMAPQLEKTSGSDILLDYRGQLHEDVDRLKLFRPAHESFGAIRSPRRPLPFPIRCSGYISSHRLTLTLEYSNRTFREESMTVLATHLRAELLWAGL